MSPLIFCSILAVFLVLPSAKAFDADAYHAVFKDDEYPDKCVIKSSDGTKLVINSEENASYPGKCAEIFCGRQSWALVYTCKTKYPPKGCEFGESINQNASYPDCCPRRLKCNAL